MRVSKSQLARHQILEFLWNKWGRVVRFAVLLVAPWHLYQLTVNRDWYWNEHVLDEHLRWGWQTPENVSSEGHVSFYLSRAWELDPGCSNLPAHKILIFSCAARRVVVAV